MPSPAISTMLAQVDLARNLLAQIDDRRTTVATALESALATATSCRAELKALKARHSAIQADISAQRFLLMRHIMSSFPNELLRAVFLALTAGQERRSLEEDRCDAYDPIRAATPFRLAAVCGRWRQVALGFPELWTYIGVPKLVGLEPDLARAFYHYVKAVLQRSQPQGYQAPGQPLRIVLDWRGVSWDDSEYHQKVLDLLGRYAYRWGRIDAALPQGFKPSHANTFRRSTPMLRRVCIALVGSDDVFPWTEHLPSYLPDCPQIRYLMADFFFFRPTVPLPYITSLHLVVIDGISSSVFWDVLRLTPHLRVLSMTFEALLDGVTNPSPPVSLAMLTTIAVYGKDESFSWVAAGIHIPNVTTLRCASNWDLHTAGLLDNLTELVVEFSSEDYPVTSQAPGHIRDIDSLRRLSIRHCNHIQGSFFSAAQSPDVCWNQLHSIDLEDITLDDDAASDFTDFIRTRTAHDGSPPLEVHIEDCDMPKWFNAEMWHILGDRFVHDTDSEDASGSSGSSDEDDKSAE